MKIEYSDANYTLIDIEAIRRTLNEEYLTDFIVHFSNGLIVFTDEV